MKRLISIFMLIVMIFSLYGCGETVKNDAGFLKNMADGLEARWKISGKNTIITTVDKYKDYDTSCVKSELDKIGDLSDYTFEDENLRLLAEKYVEALNMQKSGIRYYGIDNEKYAELWYTGYDERSKIIYLLVNDYGLKVSDKYTDILDEFMVNAEILLEEEEEAARRVIEISISDEYLGKTYYYKKNSSRKDCFVESFEYSIDYWNNDDTATVTLRISGEKKSDYETTSSPCYVSWKLRDEQGAVVESGTFKTTSLAVGEKFKNCDVKIYNLPIGTYTIELINTVG